MVAATELPIDTLAEGVTEIQLAQTIFGPGVTILRASYSGDTGAAGIYNTGDTVAPGATPGNTGVILSTGQAEDFTNSSGEANQGTATSTINGTQNNLPDFDGTAGTNTFDAAFLDVDFVPSGNQMAMQFTFSSEEYPEFQNSIYQDFVQVWINGTPVPLGVGNGDIDPGNIGTNENQNLFVDNLNDAVNSEHDGLTLTLGLTIPVNAGQTNSIRIGIADVADSNYDSAVLIAANSLQTVLVGVDDATTLAPNGATVLDVTANDVHGTNAALFVTHINDVPVEADDSVTLATGQTVTLNADGTLTITGDGDAEDFNFTYGVSDNSLTDTALVNVSSVVPCFAAGTHISTPLGERRVETLRPGEFVSTRDDGAQAVRWVGRRTLAAKGAFAPIHVAANTFGRHGALIVSPEHRILIRDALSELLFGEAEVLVAAKHLVNGKSVRRRPGGLVTYVHLLFDRHQVIYSEGLATESFLPGPQSADLFENPTFEEICAIFPEIDPRTGTGYSPAARRTLKRFEVGLWRRGYEAA